MTVEEPHMNNYSKKKTLYRSPQNIFSILFAVCLQKIPLFLEGTKRKWSHGVEPTPKGGVGTNLGGVIRIHQCLS